MKVRLATWLLPHTFPVSAQVARDRLSWPTSYWNATGLIAAFALVWTTALSCSAAESPRSRVLSAMAVPFPAAALIFTASRGAVAVALVGLLIAIVMIRSSATPGGLATVAPAIGISAALALGVHGLNVPAPASAAIDAGRRLAVLLLVVSLAAGAARIVFLRADEVLSSFRTGEVEALHIKVKLQDLQCFAVDSGDGNHDWFLHSGATLFNDLDLIRSPRASCN